jgi:hypothetical protein
MPVNFNAKRYSIMDDEPNYDAGGVSLFPEGNPAERQPSQDEVIQEMIARAKALEQELQPRPALPADPVPAQVPETQEPIKSDFGAPKIDEANPLESIGAANRARNYAIADSTHNSGNIGDFMSLVSRATAGIGNVRGKMAQTAVPQYMADLKKTSGERADRMNKADEDYSKMLMQKALIDVKAKSTGEAGYKATESASRTKLNEARAAGLVTQGEYNQALSDPTSYASLMARLLASGMGMTTAPDVPGSAIQPLLKSLGGAYGTSAGYDAKMAQQESQRIIAENAARAGAEKQDKGIQAQKELEDQKAGHGLQKLEKQGQSALEIAKEKARLAAIAAAKKAEEDRKKGLLPKAPKPGAENKAIDDLRKEYNRQKIVTDSAVISEGHERMQYGIKNPTAAGDVALLYGYMKILDPGSTVRESEFATAKNAGSIPERIWGKFNQAKSGQLLTPSQRADFAKAAKGTYQGQLKALREVNERYKGLAKSRGLKTSDLLLQGERKKIRLPSGFKGNRISYQGKPFSWNATEKVYEEEE